MTACRRKGSSRTRYNETDEQSYASLADELNDRDVNDPTSPSHMTVDDFEPRMVAEARVYATEHGLAFPPGIGDFDRYCEARWDRERRSTR